MRIIVLMLLFLTTISISNAYTLNPPNNIYSLNVSLLNNALNNSNTTLGINVTSNPDYTFWWNFSNGYNYLTPVLRGLDGSQGSQGIQGIQGVAGTNGTNVTVNLSGQPALENFAILKCSVNLSCTEDILNHTIFFDYLANINNGTNNITNNITTYVNTTSNITNNITNNITSYVNTTNNITNNVTNNITTYINTTNNITGTTNNITNNITEYVNTTNNITNNITNQVNSSGYIRDFYGLQGTVISGTWIMGDINGVIYAQFRRSLSGGGSFFRNDGNNNAEYDYKGVYLPSGQYNLTVSSHGDSVYGKLNIVWGTSLSTTIDEYYTTPIDDVITVYSFNVTTSSKNNLRIYVNSKNPSSGGYYVDWELLRIEKVGEI